MGFRDLKCFNQALLAKQMWRLHNNANPLLTAVLKARYFKHCNPLQANRGFDPSFSWRSIWGAKSLLLEGLAWRVGSGNVISVADDSWILENGRRTRPGFLNEPEADMLVWHLIDHEARMWKVDTLRAVFNEHTVANILAIPLSPTVVEDRAFWSLTNNGCYSVKTGYWLGMSDSLRITVTSHDDDVWKKLWNFHWPPKLKHFMWRACKDSLPVNAVRHYRHLASSPTCSRCNTEAETVCHALVDYTTNQSLWLNHPLFNLFSDAPRNSLLMDVFKWLLSYFSKEEIDTCGASLWACWMSRNKVVMDQSTCDVRQLAIALSKMVTDYNLYNQKIGVSLSHQRFISFQKWEPPCEGWIKVNFDAHVGSNFDRGMGVVYRDDRGKVLLTGTRKVTANWDVHNTEAAAAIFALELACRFGYHTIYLEGDSQKVLNAITSGEDGATPFHLLLDHILLLCNSLSSVICSFVRRNGNTVAHMIARWDTGNAREKICMEPFPPSLQCLADLDFIL